MRIALAQFNPLIGDVDGNVTRMTLLAAQACAQRADLVVFPEQSVLGYPAKDLLLRREVVARNVAALEQLAAAARGVALLVGFAEPRPLQADGRPCWNAAALLANGAVEAIWRKTLLPNYDVFDEARYFQPAASAQPVVSLAGRRMGVAICEDMLFDHALGRPRYSADPARALHAAGADLIVNLSASPYWLDKHLWRRERMAADALRLGVDVVLVNQVGGNDELVFDGASFCVRRDGVCLAQAGGFSEELVVLDLDSPPAALPTLPHGPASLRAALTLGLRDYVRKCGFSDVVLGLSGGIDSAVVACLAADALGPAHVHAVAMPSRFSSDHSLTDARALAAALGVRLTVAPIEPLHATAERVLAPLMQGRAPDVTEENVQARLRGMLLMALSNKFGELLLTTGNKSELAVGYCTLYGDMCGGLAVISDVPKTMVYQLARQINDHAGEMLIPQSTLTKPPSAELRPGQTDQDALPPYEVLDEILTRYEERMESVDEIIAAGLDAQTVHRVITLLYRSEYKRQQAAPGLKVTTRAFGFGRRMPIAAKAPAG